MVEQAKVGEGSAEAKPDATEGRSRRSSNGARRSKTPKVAPGASGGKRKSPATLEKLFEDGLKDIYYAEKKILTALPGETAPANGWPAAACPSTLNFVPWLWS